jgi:signal transduction histidine kinase
MILEINRIQSLMECKLLDTPDEREFDEIVKIAAFICDVPICLISLVDESRQWFKARVGLEARETPRNIAFCDYAIRSADPLIIPDALEDDRFKDNPLVISGPKIRFYAGVPLEIAPGLRIGTLCVIDSRPRQLDPAQIRRLEMLARQTCDQIRLRRSLYSLEDAAKERAIVAEGSRLAGLREMAGGLAHEVNNPLALILAKASLITLHAERKKLDAGFILEQSKAIAEIVDRIATLVQSLRVFAGIGSVRKSERVCLLDCVQDALGFCRQKITEAGISLDLSPELAETFVKGDRILLSQVILNLLNNAHDSIRSLPERKILITAQRAGEWIHFAVEDSGSPISMEIQRRLFEPFFTTKPTGSGTGLGLSISSGILSSHGGELRYDSKADHPRFILELPAIQEYRTALT